MRDSNTLNKLSEIRRKFVGSGEEHELLSGLTAEWQEAYAAGWKECEEKFLDQSRRDDDAVRFAKVIANLSCEAHQFIYWDTYHDPTDDFYLKMTAAWLRSIGRTPEQMRKLADEMERALKPEESVA